VAVKDADVEVVDEDGALGAGASLAQADAVPCGGPPLVVRGAPPMAAMRRTVCPDRTSWGVPLMGRSDARTGWWGRRRRSTRTAVGARLPFGPGRARALLGPRLPCRLGRSIAPIRFYLQLQGIDVWGLESTLSKAAGMVALMSLTDRLTCTRAHLLGQRLPPMQFQVAT